MIPCQGGKVDAVMKLLELSMETYFKTLDEKIWVQVDGCPIGELISGEIAEIYMNCFEQTAVLNEVLTRYSGSG